MLLLALLPSAAASDTAAIIDELIQKMKVASDAVNDGTWLLRIEEWKDGQAIPAQDIEVKFRRAPESIYFHWVGEVYNDRELLWHRNTNDGNLYVNTGALIPNLNLNPLGSLAMRDSRHPIWMGEMTRIVDLVSDGARLLDSRDDLTAVYEDLGEQDVYGTRSHCYTAELPYDIAPNLIYAPRIRLCLSTTTGLPSRFTAWADEDGARRQVEDYIFRQLKVNVGLTDMDFDTNNPAYGF